MTAAVLATPCSTASITSSLAPLLSGTCSATNLFSGLSRTRNIAMTITDSNRLCVLSLTSASLSLGAYRRDLIPRYLRTSNRPYRGSSSSRLRVTPEEPSPVGVEAAQYRSPVPVAEHYLRRGRPAYRRMPRLATDHASPRTFLFFRPLITSPRARGLRRAQRVIFVLFIVDCASCLLRLTTVEK